MPAIPLPSSSRPSKRAHAAVSESALIATAARLFGAGRRAGAGVEFGIGDDTAVLALPARGMRQVFTVDTLAAGTHFTLADPPQAVGWKAMAVNISDIAAMGGMPAYAVISLALPPGTPRAYAEGVLRGIRRAARAFGVRVAGGDTIGCGVISVSIAMLGLVERGRVCYRHGARPGDVLAVTGPLGGSLRSGRHLRFTPRVKEARWLVRHARPAAMMDLSDGLALDSARMAQASGVTLAFDSAKIPRRRGVALDAALHDGEDFELLCAFSPRVLTPRRQQEYQRAFGAPLILIGRALKGRPRVFLDSQPLTPTGFDHFAAPD